MQHNTKEKTTLLPSLNVFNDSMAEVTCERMRRSSCVQHALVLVRGLIAVARSSAATSLEGRFLDCNQQKTQIEGYCTLLVIAKVVGFLDTTILLYVSEGSRPSSSGVFTLFYIILL